MATCGINADRHLITCKWQLSRGPDAKLYPTILRMPSYVEPTS